ncbi:helix-turn-helix domain-containing protein [Chryseobacterium tructae]|uniref:Helix-turn-helix domain-containing protein n=1 Tax=Chryseobacterium tructae TaxID=1037380 RepID=A0ABV7XW85_9FLAO|nr:helix-turn-helix domain-containing protein [Chryseobacterium tructae]MDN3692540.1 helix-turn-helix domain-containing protein [Chryseobacterium tructae]
MMASKCIMITLLLFFSITDFHAEENRNDYVWLRSQYENLKKNDSTAFRYLRIYISKAKKDSDFARLSEAYKFAVYFTPSNEGKLSYSDSTIYAALRSKQPELIGDAYLGKGIFYYFNLKKYEPALAEYLKAYEYSKNGKDEYLHQKIIYHLGVVKSYLGFYQEALELFKQCSAFFEKKSKEKSHPNTLFNFKRGYYNSIHQMVICYRNLKEYDMADVLVENALLQLADQDRFLLEKNYLLKCRGISAYHHKNYAGSIHDLNAALEEIVKSNDFSWLSVIYYYLGKNHMVSNENKGIYYLEKVDSIFNRHTFILPEVRPAYEDLIMYYSEKGDQEKQLYYTKQLLKVDKLIGKDFTYLSSKIHREYDERLLTEGKNRLEKMSWRRMMYMLVFIVSTIFFLCLFLLKYQKEQHIKLKYLLLQDRLNNKQYDMLIIDKQDVIDNSVKTGLPEELYKELDQKLQQFEIENGFKQRGLTLGILATKMNTNTSYLSTFINENKGENFKTYINRLRISYITQLLNSERKYLLYTIEALAEESGISTRQHFSDLFYEVNGLRPTDFIRKRKQELKME